MKFFLDTANLDEIRQATSLGVLDGVTTNPSLIAKEGAAEIKLNSPLLETPVFRDESVAAGRKYIYRVTALDLTHNESPPSEEVPAETPAM